MLASACVIDRLKEEYYSLHLVGCVREKESEIFPFLPISSLLVLLLM